MSKDKCPPRAACVCIGVCVCNVCALKRKEKENGSLKTRQTGSSPVPGCCRGDKRSKRDVLAEAGPIVCGLKKELFDWLSRKSGSVLQL